MLKVIFIIFVLAFVGYGIYMSRKPKKEAPPSIGGDIHSNGPGGNRPNKS